MKYFVLGAFSSAFFLYGIALVYGATGIDQPRRRSRASSPPTCSPTTACCWPASRCCWSGFGFKVAAVPFHVLDPRRVPGRPTPDRRLHGLGREGRRLRRAAPGVRARPSPATAPTGSRSSTRSPCSPCWSARCSPSCQTDVKRMLAYSSISHAGFILVGVAGGHRPGHLGGALLPGRLHVHGRRQLRRRHRGRPHGRRRTTPRRLPGPRPRGRPVLAARLHRVPARPGRRAAHRRASSPSST